MDTRYAVGVDVGGTTLAAGLVAFPSGALHDRRVVRTRPERGGQAVLDDAFGLASQLVASARRDAGADVVGVGVGVAELVDLDGNVRSSHTIPWEGVDVSSRFVSLAPVTVVESDVRVGALGEAMFGAGSGHRIFAYVSVGTGISACLVIDGRPYAGAHGNAVVLATGPYGLECPSCGGWAEVALEEYASGPALARRYEGGVIGAEEVVEAATRGDARAEQIVSSGGRALGHAIGLLINLWDPGVVVVGGGLGLAGGTYWQHLLEGMGRTAWPPERGEGAVVKAELGADASVVGAATAAWRLARPSPTRDGGRAGTNHERTTVGHGAGGEAATTN
jgi:glucokinase